MRIRVLALIGAAAILAAPMAHAKTFELGDNPMCIKGDSGILGCLRASDTEVAAGGAVTFFARKTVYPTGTVVCLARASEGYGTYIGIDACAPVKANGKVTIIADLGVKGTAWYDIGDEKCLARKPANRPIKKCGDNGGVQSTPVQVTVN